MIMRMHAPNVLQVAHASHAFLFAHCWCQQRFEPDVFDCRRQAKIHRLMQNTSVERSAGRFGASQICSSRDRCKDAAKVLAIA